MSFWNRHASVLRCGLLMLCIAVADGLADFQLSLWVLYLFPIGLATWNLGVRYGWGFAAVAVALLFAIGLNEGHPYDKPIYFYVAEGSKAIAFALLVAFIGAIRNREVERVFFPSRSRK